MSKHKRLSNLFEQLRKKLDSTPSALKKRIQRKAESLCINSDEALIILARENNVGYSRALRILLPESRSRVTTTIQTIRSQTTQSKGKRHYKNLKSVILKTKFGSIIEPFLSATVKTEAKKMAEKVYPVLYIFENSIRNFINNVLEKEFGPGWWLEKMNTQKLSDIVTKVKKRMEKEERIAWHGKRGTHPIYYSDFNDLITILESHQSKFNKYLTNQRGRTKWLLSKLYEIEPSRNVVAHHNPLSDRDISRVEGNLMDWLKELEFIRNNNLL